MPRGPHVRQFGPCRFHVINNGCVDSQGTRSPKSVRSGIDAPRLVLYQDLLPRRNLFTTFRTTAARILMEQVVAVVAPEILVEHSTKFEADGSAHPQDDERFDHNRWQGAGRPAQRNVEIPFGRMKQNNPDACDPRDDHKSAMFLHRVVGREFYGPVTLYWAIESLQLRKEPQTYEVQVLIVPLHLG